MNQPSDTLFKDWATKIKTSDRHAFQTFFEATYPSVVRYARGFTRDEAAANDVAQEIYLRLWNSRASLDENRSLRALLYVSARNLALNYNRKHTFREMAHQTMKQPAPPPLPDDTLGAQELAEKIKAWIQDLPARRREAFQLSRFDGLSYQEIAQVMGLSERTVEQHIRLALSTLRDRLKALEPDLLNR